MLKENCQLLWKLRKEFHDKHKLYNKNVEKYHFHYEKSHSFQVRNSRTFAKKNHRNHGLTQKPKAVIYRNILLQI